MPIVLLEIVICIKFHINRHTKTDSMRNKKQPRIWKGSWLWCFWLVIYSFFVALRESA